MWSGRKCNLNHQWIASTTPPEIQQMIGRLLPFLLGFGLFFRGPFAVKFLGVLPPLCRLSSVPNGEELCGFFGSQAFPTGWIVAFRGLFGWESFWTTSQDIMSSWWATWPTWLLVDPTKRPWKTEFFQPTRICHPPQNWSWRKRASWIIPTNLAFKHQWRLVIL